MSEGDAREEFLAEAQEIIEGLSRDLLLLDQADKEGRDEPELINEVFRGVHTLKGIAGMFGYHQLGAVTHALEDLLDDLRLGRVSLAQSVLDVLFEGVENFQRLLGEDPEGPPVDLEAYAAAIDQVQAPAPLARETLEDYALDSSVLSVLTEYEEHRLRTNIEQGVTLFRLLVRFSLATIDSSLEELKTRAKPLAEIITYLPSMGGGGGEDIDLEVLLASRASLDELREALGDQGEQLSAVERRTHAPSRLPPAPSIPAGPGAARPTSAPPAPLPPASIAPHHQTSAPAAPAALSKEPAADLLSLRSVASTVRVDIRKLDHLMNVVGELALVRSAMAGLREKLQRLTDEKILTRDLHRIGRAFERHLSELQDGILDVRMVPLGQVFDKLARIVRQVAREHEKEVQLVVTGAETEVDKLIVEELSDPLMHIIRNAIDHGIESPKMRELGGKPALGTLALNAYQKGSHVVLEIEDDGAGMSIERLIETAVRRGLMSHAEAEELTHEEVLALVFLPGFTTRSSITDISGRGVGMDVVKTNISRLGGIIDIQSEYGSGTKLTITLPVTLAIISALLVKVAGRPFAIPITAVQEAILLVPQQVRTLEGREVLSLRDTTLPLCRLNELFGLESRDPGHRSFVVVTALANRRLGLIVDELEGQQDIVIKALGPSLTDVPGFSGATDLGDERVALVLDAPGLLEELLATTEWRRVGEARLAEGPR
ncbi:MAG: chemotaxis protein CheA [Deltaproteobacteria bacterium]|nr:chemotaxis protein CheA [Deltaproteobacteria bacterium]